MNDDLDALFARLARQPEPHRLDGLEASVDGHVREARAVIAAPWQFAAVGLALAAGLGVGGSATPLRQSSALTADLSGGIGLAPSSLLDAAT